MCQANVQVSVGGTDTVVGPGPTPPTVAETDYGGHIVRAGHKRYFFDPGSNQKGDFVRITEVCPHHASASWYVLHAVCSSLDVFVKTCAIRMYRLLEPRDLCSYV